MFPADEHPFLESILADPSEDGPRLVYADYLDETGQVLDARRAELIRTQVALDRLPREHARRAELVNREVELVESYGSQWVAPLASLGAKFLFRRGIPDAVMLDAATLLSRGEELFDNTQVRSGRSFVRRVKLQEPARVLPDLAECPLLNQIEELDLGWSDLGNGGVTLLLRSPHLGSVTCLNLGNNRLDDAGVIALARAATLPRLQTLVLNDNEIGAKGAAELAESPFLAGLVDLDLSGNEMNEVAVRAIIAGRATSRLRSLKLAENPIASGVAVFVRSAMFGRTLNREPDLDFHRCQVEASGAAALAAAPEIHRATGLNLSENYLGDSGVQALGRGNFENLRSLQLARNQIADAGARSLLDAALPRLELLDVSGNRLSKGLVDALKTAARSRGFALQASNNGTETMTALPPTLDAELEEVAGQKRLVTYPARPR
jgi:uncharacterized protein (TIGR02996 family)